MYPEEITIPMRQDLSEAGFDELTTPAQVEDFLKKEGLLLLVVNSVCGCAAGNARPAVKMSLASDAPKPDHMATVFAGVDKAATEKAREHMLPFPPSSPCIALFKDGELVHMLERHHIEGRPAAMISENLQDAYREYC